MSGGMYLAAAGALVQQLRLETVANNVANINTAGFKGEKTIFRVAQEAPPLDVRPVVGLTQPLSPFAPPFATIIDFSQGAIRQTGNPLDVAINGDGFFSVQTPNGIQYTRQGSFTLNEQGLLITQDGYPVQGQGGEITLEEGRIEIDEEGGIYVNGDEIGRLQLTVFDNNAGLKRADSGRFTVADPGIAGRRAENTTVSQGYIEGSNVNPIRAMTEMIETSRAFEAYQKVIQTADEATAKSINDVGKTV